MLNNIDIDYRSFSLSIGSSIRLFQEGHGRSLPTERESSPLGKGQPIFRNDRFSLNNRPAIQRGRSQANQMGRNSLRL